jgi:hypothetical protein
MGDSSKSKNNPRSSAHGSSNSSLALRNWTLSPRANLDSQLTASVSPVTSVKDTHSWLEKKGWSLASKKFSKNKLAEILFSAVLAFKLPTEVDTALHSVTYLIHNQVKEDLASSLSAKLQ